MRRSLAPLCVALSCAVSYTPSTFAQASSVQFYGLLDTGITYVNHVNGAPNWSMHPGAMQGSRWGVRGREDLGGGLSTIFQLEAGVNLDTGTTAQGGLGWGRRSVVGMELAGVGTVLVGRQPDFLDDIAALTSTMDFGSQVVGIHGLDRTNTQRANNSVRLNSSTFGGLNFTLMAGLGENTNTTKAGSTLSGGVNYKNGNFRIAAGFHQSRAGTGTGAGAAATSADAGYGSIGAVPGAAGVIGGPGDVVLRTGTLGAGYQWGPARLHAAYSQISQPLAVAGGRRALGSLSNRMARIVDIGVSVEVLPAMFVSASAIRNRASFVGAEGGDLKQFNLGVDYFLSKRTDVYFNTGYQTASNMIAPGLENAAPGGDRSQLLTRIGIRHKF